MVRLNPAETVPKNPNEAFQVFKTELAGKPLRKTKMMDFENLKRSTTRNYSMADLRTQEKEMGMQDRNVG
jgi:hypothetical protein